MIDIVFLGSKEIGAYCLNALIMNPEAKVSAVLTNDRTIDPGEKGVSRIAAKNDIPVLNSPDDIPETDLLISVQYHMILKNKHLSKARKAAVNLHMAPLPEYRGCNQFSFAVMDEVREFGTTLHLMDKGIDSGDILFEKRFSVPRHCHVKQLYELTVKKSKELFAEKLNDLLNERFTPVSQQKLIPERGTSTHYRYEIEELKKIDPNLPEAEIEKRVRASYFPPFSPPYTIIDGEKRELSPENWRKILKKN